MGKPNFKFCIVILIFAFCILNFLGCVVRTYSVTKERVDQGLSEGNMGYLKGEAPYSEQAKERKNTRTMQVVETEFFAPIRFEKGPKKQVERKPLRASSDTEAWGNRGYIGGYQSKESAPVYLPKVTSSAAVSMQKYTVQKGDTLQKISQKFYGTSKKWHKIFKANEGVLKGPDKIYPGQVIDVPAQELKETEENLK